VEQKIYQEDWVVFIRMGGPSTQYIRVTQDIISDVQKHPQAENEGGCQKKVYM
jgi:hypothetical protein